MTAQKLQEQIQANSLAWHESNDPEERNRLHEENVALYGKLDGLTGMTSGFDSASGRWSSSYAGGGDYQATAAPEVKDLSGLVLESQKAANQMALENLDRAYAESRDALKAERSAIGGTYQSARNATAGQNEVEQRNMKMYAMSSGLNSGAAGQIALSQSVAAQNDLNQLYAQEANAYAENDKALSEMEREYNFAVAQAKTEGDYALANALYDEMSRVDEAQRDLWKDTEEMNREVYKLNRDNRRYDTEQYAKQEQTAYDRAWDEKNWNYQVSQDAVKQANTLWEQQRASGNDAWDRQMDLASQAIQRQNANTASANAATSRMNTQLRLAQELAGMGDFEGYGALGYSKSQISAMEEMWKNYMAMK